MNELKVFSVEEAEALIPSLSELVGQQFAIQSEIERGIARLAEASGQIPKSLDDAPLDSSAETELKREIRGNVEDYERGWAKIEELGAVVKDPQSGLVDFYGYVGGRIVWLCWRYGEAKLDWYHDLDAGFAGRRRLRGQAPSHYLN